MRLLLQLELHHRRFLQWQISHVSWQCNLATTAALYDPAATRTRTYQKATAETTRDRRPILPSRLEKFRGQTATKHSVLVQDPLRSSARGFQKVCKPEMVRRVIAHRLLARQCPG